MFKVRLFKLLLSLPIFALGGAISIRSGIGVSAWDTFALGVADVTHIQYGTITMLTGLVVLAIVLIMKQPVGIGTLLDALIIGKLCDLFLWLDFIPTFDFLPFQILMLLSSLIIICIGSVLYTTAALSVGPRDTLMLALAKRFTKVPVGLIKSLIEGTVFIIGVIFGAPVGIGTLICVFGTGFIYQLTLNIFHVDVRNITQENIFETLNRFKKVH